MFPTVRSFEVYEKEGILNLLKSQLENGITVRMLLSEKDRPSQGVWQEISTFPNLHIQHTDQLPASKLTMIIVDSELSLVIEEKKYEDPVGIASSYVIENIPFCFILAADFDDSGADSWVISLTLSPCSIVLSVVNATEGVVSVSILVVVIYYKAAKWLFELKNKIRDQR